MHLNGDEAMAQGAAFYAANISTSFKVTSLPFLLSSSLTLLAPLLPFPVSLPFLPSSFKRHSFS